MAFAKGHPDYVTKEQRAAAGIKISLSQKGKPFTAARRAALQPYWDSKKGAPSPRRNGIYISCPQCTKLVYKNQRDLKRVKQCFCSKSCAYAFRDRGLTSANARIRDSREYTEWRRHVFQRDDYTCQSCNKRGGKLNADHELSFSAYPALRFEVLNGRTLCIPCHQATPNYGARASRAEFQL